MPKAKLRVVAASKGYIESTSEKLLALTEWPQQLLYDVSAKGDSGRPPEHEAALFPAIRNKKERKSAPEAQMRLGVAPSLS